MDKFKTKAEREDFEFEDIEQDGPNTTVQYEQVHSQPVDLCLPF